ncbi:MAG: hypothetical protein ABJC19_03410 [Gemmatimonadota bacterium]
MRSLSWTLTIVAMAGMLGCVRKDAPATTDSATVQRPLPVLRDTGWIVAADHFGRYQIGWSVAQFNAASGEGFRPTHQVDGGCDQYHPTSFPVGVSLMVIGDSIVRFDVDSTGIVTDEGVGVGDLESRVRGLYGDRVVVTPHKYTGPTGHYLTVSPPGDSRHRIIFETDGQRVVRYHAGQRPAVELVEGCS